MPTFSALLTGATLHLEGHVFPLVRANLRDHPQQLHVLGVVPGPFARLGCGGALRCLLLGVLLWLLKLHFGYLYSKRYQSIE